MSFNTHVDHFGLVALSGEPPALKIRTSPWQKSPGVVAEAEDEIGDVIATDRNGSKEKLTVDYLIQRDLTLATLLIMGTLQDDKALLTGFQITTTKGKAPELSVEGARMNAEAEQGATIVLPAISVQKLHKAQILAGAFTFVGAGCKLNECTLRGSCNNSLGEVAGEICSHDVQRGMLEASGSIVQSGATPPTITAGTGWTFVEDPSKGDPEGGHDVWNFKLTKPLATTPAA